MILYSITGFRYYTLDIKVRVLLNKLDSDSETVIMGFMLIYMWIGECRLVYLGYLFYNYYKY